MKFWVGDEYSGLHVDKVNWVQQTFDKKSYRFVDEGYFTYDRYVIFEREEDAMLFKLKWM